MISRLAIAKPASTLDAYQRTSGRAARSTAGSSSRQAMSRSNVSFARPRSASGKVATSMQASATRAEMSKASMPRLSAFAVFKSYTRKKRSHVDAHDLPDHPSCDPHHRSDDGEHDPSVPLREQEPHTLRLLLIKDEPDEDRQQADDPSLRAAHRGQRIDLPFDIRLLLQRFRQRFESIGQVAADAPRHIDRRVQEIELRRVDAYPHVGERLGELTADAVLGEHDRELLAKRSRLPSAQQLETFGQVRARS